jgi:co-chaperonin GroES (HSP10)
VLLEDKAHAKFDGGSIYRRAQSKDVMVVWRHDELIINKDIILVSKRDMVRERPSGLLMLNQEECYSAGEVFMSGSEEIKEKDVILYAKDGGLPVTYKGVDYLVLLKREIIGIR